MQRILSVTAVALLLFGCATAEEKSLGKIATGGGRDGVPVYFGDINRKYRVLKEVRQKVPQISGPLYYDWTNGAHWMSSMERDAGADAVINFDTRAIPIKCKNILWPYACPREDRVKYFEAWGTAVVFDG